MNGPNHKGPAILAPFAAAHPGVERGLLKGRVARRREEGCRTTVGERSGVPRSLAIILGFLSILLAPAPRSRIKERRQRARPSSCGFLPESSTTGSSGADSAVVFSHETHFALAGNRCTGCHPQPYRMLTPVHRVSHREMNAGGSCGTCHDGKHAFGVRDGESCGLCHSGRPTTQLAAGDTVPDALPRRRRAAVPSRSPMRAARPRPDRSPSGTRRTWAASAPVPPATRRRSR